jgi:pilus assembly protein Flp/PilA
MIKKLLNFLQEEEGASMVEYGLLVALIALVVAVGAGVLGNAISAKFNSAATTVNNAS